MNTELLSYQEMFKDIHKEFLSGLKYHVRSKRYNIIERFYRSKLNEEFKLGEKTRKGYKLKKYTEFEAKILFLKDLENQISALIETEVTNFPNYENFKNIILTKYGLKETKNTVDDDLEQIKSMVNEIESNRKD